MREGAVQPSSDADAVSSVDLYEGEGYHRGADEEDDEQDSSEATPPMFDPSVLAGPYRGAMYSLAFFKTTPRWVRYAVMFAMVLAHGMYVYGQVMPMWRLYVQADVQVWLNASNFATRTLFKQLGLNESNYIDLDYEDDIDTFDYGFAIKELWAAKNLGNKFGPRTAAGVLVLFSGVWPHLKLILLNLYWNKPHTEMTRTTGFYWLSSFGKWSLADVFVVCIMIGVLHLDLDLDPQAIQEGLVHEIPRAIELLSSVLPPQKACEKLIGNCTAQPVLKAIECAACEGAVHELYTHPKWVENGGELLLKGVKSSGGGVVELRIGGLHGIYVFCFGVITSLILSFVIDLLDHKARAYNAKRRRGEPPTDALGITGSPGASYSSLVLNNIMNERAHDSGTGPSRFAEYRLRDRTLTIKDDPRPVLLIRRVSRRVWSTRQYTLLCLFAVLTIFLVFLGIFQYTMERRVPGAIPTIIHEVIGLEWERPYSLWTLMEVTGQAGGPDWMLMGTFAFFIVFGPIARAVAVVADLVIPWHKSSHKRLMTVINFLGAFSAWEVFFVALFLVDMEMPSITNTIVEIPECKILDNANESCLEVEFDMLPEFLWIMIGGAVLMLVASLAVKLGFKGLDPYCDGDRGGPYCCESCPYIFIDFDSDIRKSNTDSLLHGQSSEADALLNGASEI